MGSVRQTAARLAAGVGNMFRNEERTPMGFCDGLDKPFLGLGQEQERGCGPPKYHTHYSPIHRIHKEARRGNTAAVEQLITHSTTELERVDLKSRTALHFACVYGKLKVVELLLKSHCNISPRDSKAATPLIKAVQCRRMKCLDLLLSYGADPNLTDRCENTALHYAVYNGDVTAAACLLKYKTNIEAVNENNMTPLLLALKQNKVDMAIFLINSGADIHTTDFLGRTTLMYAVRCGSEVIIRLLFQRGIDPSKTDSFQWTAMKYAVESKSKMKGILDECLEAELENTQGKSEGQEEDVCSMPNMEVQESLQTEPVEKADTKPSKIAWGEKESPLKPTQKVKNHSSDEIEITMIQPFRAEEVIEVSSEEEQEKKDNNRNAQQMTLISEPGSLKKDAAHISGTKVQGIKSILKSKRNVMEVMHTAKKRKQKSRKGESQSQKEDVSHLPGPVEQRSENMARVETEESPKKPHYLSPNTGRKDSLPKRRLPRKSKISFQLEQDFPVTSREQKREDGSASSQPLLKEKREAEQRNEMDTAVVSREGSIAAGDAPAAAAASDTSPENGSILQIKCKKTDQQPFPVPKEEDDGLKKKIPDGKNKSTEHSNVMDDCQISQSVSEDYDLPNRDPIVTQLIKQLQMHQKAIHERQKKVQELEYETAQKELELSKLRLDLKQQTQNYLYFYEQCKKQYETEVEEKHLCEMCLKRQEKKDTVLRSPRFDTDKLQKEQGQQTEIEESNVTMKEHLQKLEVIIKQQAEKIDQLQKSLPTKRETLVGTENLTQGVRQENHDNSKENPTTSQMDHLELRLRSIESVCSQIQVFMQEISNRINMIGTRIGGSSQKLRENNDEMRDVYTQNLTAMMQCRTPSLNAMLVPECHCVTHCFRALAHHRCFLSQHTVEIPASDPQSSNGCPTVGLRESEEERDLSKNIRMTQSLQSDLNEVKKICVGLGKGQARIMKMLQMLTECQNGAHITPEVSHASQHKMDIPTDRPSHESRAQTGSSFPTGQSTPAPKPCAAAHAPECAAGNLHTCYPVRGSLAQSETLGTTSSSQMLDKHVEICIETSRAETRSSFPTGQSTPAPKPCAAAHAPEFAAGNLHTCYPASRSLAQSETLGTTSRSQKLDEDVEICIETSRAYTGSSLEHRQSTPAPKPCAAAPAPERAAGNLPTRRQVRRMIAQAETLGATSRSQKLDKHLKSCIETSTARTGSSLQPGQSTPAPEPCSAAPAPECAAGSLLECCLRGKNLGQSEILEDASMSQYSDEILKICLETSREQPGSPLETGQNRSAMNLNAPRPAPDCVVAAACAESPYDTDAARKHMEFKTAQSLERQKILKFLYSYLDERLPEWCNRYKERQRKNSPWSNKFL